MSESDDGKSLTVIDGNLPAQIFHDVSDWGDEPDPPRRWVAFQRIPLAHVSILSGPGGVGKTMLALQLAVAVLRGADWCGSVCEEPGAVMVFSAEEDIEEIRRRIRAIAEHQQIPMRELAGLFVASSLDADFSPVLGAPDRSGIIRPTPLFGELMACALDIRPKLIVIESAAETFAGSEIDRAQTAQFCGLLRRLARAADAGVLLIAHPSLSGQAAGTGSSGSTQWTNGPRARLYFTGIKQDDDALDVHRELKIVKSNYGPAGETVRLRWQAPGIFVIEPKAGSLERIAADAKADDVFLQLLDAYTERGQNVSENERAPTYAPAKFAREPGVAFTKKQLGDAMRRLFTIGKLRVETYRGTDSRARERIARRAP